MFFSVAPSEWQDPRPFSPVTMNGDNNVELFYFYLSNVPIKKYESLTVSLELEAILKHQRFELLGE